MTRMLLRAPFVERIGRPFLVVRAVREADGGASASLVEAPRLLVRLEDPEREPARTPLLHLVEQRRTDAATEGARNDVEMTEHVSSQRREAFDPFVVVDDDL